jgi:hypothetical protein
MQRSVEQKPKSVLKEKDVQVPPLEEKKKNIYNNNNNTTTTTNLNVPLRGEVSLVMQYNTVS